MTLRVPKHFWVSVAISLLALGQSTWVNYKTALKPFACDVFCGATVGLQHKTNLGLYVNLVLKNQSPSPGLITQMLLAVHRQETPEDKYLLIPASFPVRGFDDVWRATPAEQVFLGPREWFAGTVNFLYLSEQQFPIATGLYVCELLVFADFEGRASFSETFRFEISADILAAYMDYREKGSTMLQEVPIVGMRAFESKKLSQEEYLALKR